MPKVHLPRSFSPIPRTFPPKGTLERAKCFQNLLIWTNINEIFIKLYNLFYVSFRPDPPASRATPFLQQFQFRISHLPPVHARLHKSDFFAKLPTFASTFNWESFANANYVQNREKKQKWKRDRQRKSEMTRTRKIKNFAEKARSGGRKRKRVIKFHKNPLLAMLTYSVCRSSFSSFSTLLVRERNALTALAKVQKKTRTAPVRAARAAFCGTHFASTAQLFNYWYCLQPLALLLAAAACGKTVQWETKAKKLPRPHQPTRMLLTFHIFVHLSLCLSLCDCHWQLNAPLDNNKHNNKN